ncbi:hypothetical protein Tco_0003377 [Tanacetum coccineum]
MINGKTVYLTKQEIQKYWDKKEKMKKGAKEAKLLAMSRPKVIKVVREKANKLKIDPKEAISTKASETLRMLRMLSMKSSRESTLKRYERLKKLPEELRIQSALPAPVPKQASSQTSGRKRKHMELEPKIKVPGMECNRSLSKGIPKMERYSLVSYLVMASMVKTKENGRFSLKLRKLIADHPDQEKLKSKKVNLEALGYHVE